MLECWHLAPDHRPTFSAVVARLEALLQTSQDYLDLGDSEAEPPDIEPDSETAFMAGAAVPVVHREDQYLEPLAGPILYTHTGPTQHQAAALTLETQTKVCPRGGSTSSLAYQAVLFKDQDL